MCTRTELCSKGKDEVQDIVQSHDDDINLLIDTKVEETNEQDGEEKQHINILLRKDVLCWSFSSTRLFTMSLLV